MTILEYSECNSTQKFHWLEQIKKADWRAAEYLANILSDGEFYKLYGSSSKIFLLTEDENLIAFCTFAEKDDIPQTEFSPWIGFVYTFPQYRGKRRMGVLFNHIFDIAKSQGIKSIYISTHDEGIYEKYGFNFFKTMNDTHGEQSRIYKITFEKKDYSNIIGKTVSGKIDRPSGSHHPRHPDMIYPINYGYVDGLIAADGAEQDVYLFGPTTPVQEYTGTIIAVWHRLNDIEDKWIVIPKGSNLTFTDEQIRQSIFFQEQYFIGELYRK